MVMSEIYFPDDEMRVWGTQASFGDTFGLHKERTVCARSAVCAAEIADARLRGSSFAIRAEYLIAKLAIPPIFLTGLLRREAGAVTAI